MEVAVHGGRGNGGLHHQRLSSTEAAMGWRDNDAMALAVMASLADGGGGDGGCCCQLCSGGQCRCHHPVISINGGGKGAIAAATINLCFRQQQLLTAPLTTAIATAA
jgi:hypothetical protein